MWTQIAQGRGGAGARCGTTQTGVAEGGLEDLPHRDVTDQ